MTISDLVYLEDISATNGPVGGRNTYFNHTVKSGETLSGITNKYYDNTSKSCYDEVAYYSGISDPDLIYPGDKVKIYEYYPKCGGRLG